MLRSLCRKGAGGGGWRGSLTLWLLLLYFFRHFIKDYFPLRVHFYHAVGLCNSVGRSVGCVPAVCFCTQLAARGGGLCDLLWWQRVPREGGGDEQAFAQRASPGLAPHPSAFHLLGWFPSIQACWLPASCLQSPVWILCFSTFISYLWIFNRKKRLRAHRDSIPRYLHTALPSFSRHLPAASPSSSPPP